MNGQETLKILNAKQLKQADAYTISNQPISSLELMEQAAHSFVKALTPKVTKKDKIIVVCGTGNNGGDGFAIARILQKKGLNATAVLLKHSNTLSPNCKINYQKVKKASEVCNAKQMPNLSTYTVIVDAIFGYGLNRTIDNWLAEIIQQINQANAIVYSVDIPSGMFCDGIVTNGSCIKSTLTLSFQQPKLAFFFSENIACIPKFKVLDIGLDTNFIAQQPSNYYLLNAIHKKVKTRPRFSHKGTYGHAFIIAGALGKMGAAILSSKACLRSGAGLVTTHIPRCGYSSIQSSIPEAMCICDTANHEITNPSIQENYQAIAVGPGIGTSPATQKMLQALLQQASKPLVIDADALNIISNNQALIQLLPANSILTPHPKEFERLVGKWGNSKEKFSLLQQFAATTNCVVVLKDAYTTIATPSGKLFFNTKGNAGMATAGSGDVLTGIITGLLAQGYPPLEAAQIGVYFHAKSGNKAAKKKGLNAIIASDIIENLNIEN